ncbi:hypothetical protein AWH48_11965 [Domibacillus aminovorans]|uniref:Uncharacterized protein n=1 Tax=Domibacillus aminovorans TaxID=29332 RepID=A0A177KI43_9BACI|nr:hypothetical protein [Domibacillus aminovorans]OAH53068.1 hypothetical protein AWH48_11965 [Domibacillus aminovorans]
MADLVARALATKANQQIAELYDVMYIPPTVSLALNPNVTAKEYGDPISSVILSGTVTKKLLDITKVEFYRGATLQNTVSNPSAEGGVFSYTENTDVVDTVSFKVKAYDEKEAVEAVKTISYVYPFYAGSVAAAAPTEAQIKALTKLVKTKSNTAHSFTASSSRFVIAYPQSYGALTSILDQNNFETIASYNLTVVNITGLDEVTIPYNVYTLNTTTTQTNFTNTFKF